MELWAPYNWWRDPAFHVGDWKSGGATWGVALDSHDTKRPVQQMVANGRRAVYVQGFIYIFRANFIATPWKTNIAGTYKNHPFYWKEKNHFPTIQTPMRTFFPAVKNFRGVVLGGFSQLVRAKLLGSPPIDKPWISAIWKVGPQKLTSMDFHVPKPKRSGNEDIVLPGELIHGCLACSVGSATLVFLRF